MQSMVSGIADVAAGGGSALLAELVTPGRVFPDMDAALGELEGATNWAEARTAGRVVPREVMLHTDPDGLLCVHQAAVDWAEARSTGQVVPYEVRCKVRGALHQIPMAFRALMLLLTLCLQPACWHSSTCQHCLDNGSSHAYRLQPETARLSESRPASSDDRRIVL
jgi:hypothetical protein